MEYDETRKNKFRTWSNESLIGCVNSPLFGYSDTNEMLDEIMYRSRNKIYISEEQSRGLKNNKNKRNVIMDVCRHTTSAKD